MSDLPASMVMLVTAALGGATGGAILGVTFAVAGRFAMRRRTLDAPRCRACSMILAAREGELSERCPECGADLAAPAAVRWVATKRLPIGRLLFTVSGVMVALAIGCGVAFVAHPWLMGLAEEGERRAIEASFARCELPGDEGAMAVAKLRQRIEERRPTDAESAAIGQWLQNCDPAVVAYGGREVTPERIDWVRVGDFVGLILTAVKRETMPIWIARRLVGAVLPPSKASMPARVRPGGTYVLGTAVEVANAPVVVHAAEHWYTPPEGPLRRLGVPPPTTRENSIWFQFTAPKTPGRVTFRQVWDVDLLPVTLSIGGRGDAPASSLPRRSDRTFEIEIAEGPETLEVVLDPSRDPLRQPGGSIQIVVTFTERQACVSFVASLTIELAALGTWELELPPAAGESEGHWIPLAVEPPSIPLVRAKAFAPHAALKGAAGLRVRFVPHPNPTLPDPAVEPRYAAAAFGLATTYDLRFVEERSAGRGTLEREYRLNAR